MASEAPVWRRLLNGWMAIAGHFGFVQTLLLLVLFYALLIGPVWTVTAKVSTVMPSFCPSRGWLSVTVPLTSDSRVTMPLPNVYRVLRSVPDPSSASTRK